MWKATAGPRSSVSTPAGSGPRAAAAVTAVTCLLVTGLLVVAVGHPSGARREEPAASGKVFSAYFRKLTRERQAMSGPPRGSAARGPVERLTPADLFIAVTTTGRYHRPRLQLLLDTWISRSAQQVSASPHNRAHLINTNCSAAHSRQALSCKMALEYDVFIDSGKKWFCHVDDDNYVSAGPLLKLLSQYGHAEDVYIGRPSLERPIEATERLGTAQMVTILELYIQIT
ncbi:hypothetical protein F2P81_010034 [Scophthalmus maximus]|uniref:Fringe-like glycosyltransferase domain-containing protein n=1 Tax=Scophthalmus maximus TaxID=52904 RepID=A0A6A4SZB8_SCOMX|nr:hypothetical protein F2P81_010034 [Scophthalmus maximus]